MAAIIHVERTGDHDSRMRWLVVRVNGRQAGHVAFGDRLDVLLEPGRNELEFDNTWTRRRVVLEVEDGAVYAAQVESPLTPLYGCMLLLFQLAPLGLAVKIVRVDTPTSPHEAP